MHVTRKIIGYTVLTVVVLLAACAAPAPQSTSGQDARSAAPATPRRAVAAIKFDPPTLNTKLNPATVAGVDNVEDLVNAGLVRLDEQGALLPQLAVAVPSLENGLWKVHPDGQMETTWTIKPNAAWHDGTKFTSADLVFTLNVVRDPDIAVFRDRSFDLIDRADAPDPATLTVYWKSTFINADSLFSGGVVKLAMPLARHILEPTYNGDKMTLTDHLYFSQEFVGTGAFKLKEWVSGSHIVLTANDQYVLGRPKLDELEVRFFPDPTTLVANILAGAVDFSLGRGISLEQALQARDQWQNGKVDTAFSKTWIVLYAQFLNPNPAIVSDTRFRRAMMHAIDRQQLVDTLEFGLSKVAHSILDPDQPQYREIEQRQVVRYEYEPAKAIQQVTDLGYTRGPDGMFRDSANQPLHVEYRTINTDINQKSAFAVGDFWRQVGVSVDTVIIPPQRATDLEYRATFPAFEMLRQPNDVRGMLRIHGAGARTPEKRFTGDNNPRYQNPELDALLDRYLTTIPRPQRIEAIGQIIHHISDQLPFMGLFYDGEPVLANNRMVGIGAAKGDATQAWNVMDWDVRQ